MAPLTIPRERGLVWGTPATDATMTLLAIRVFNELRGRNVATLSNIRKRAFTPCRSPLLCDRCHKPTGRGPHECTWVGAPRPIGLSRERINVDSIDRRIMVRQWALEGCVSPARYTGRVRQAGRPNMLLAPKGGRSGEDVNVLAVGTWPLANCMNHGVIVDAELRHEAEEWANARKTEQG